MLASFGYFTKKWFLLLIVPILIYIRRYLTYLIESKEEDNFFYVDFFGFLGKSMNGILWVIF